MATGLAADGGLCGGLAGVWAKEEAAIVASAPASTRGTNCFMGANLSGARLYCNKRRTPMVVDRASVDRALAVQQVKAMLKSGEVFAFFDVREEGEFSTKGHPLFATPLPLSRLEPRAFALLPDPATHVVLMDSGEEGENSKWGRASRAAARLGQMGYTNVAVMNGGLKAWRDAGYEVFTGVNVPSKAFGEVVEHDNDTPRIDAADLARSWSTPRPTW